MIAQQKYGCTHHFRDLHPVETNICIETTSLEMQGLFAFAAFDLSRDLVNVQGVEPGTVAKHDIFVPMTGREETVPGAVVYYVHRSDCVYLIYCTRENADRVEADLLTNGLYGIEEYSLQ